MRGWEDRPVLLRPLEVDRELAEKAAATLLGHTHRAARRQALDPAQLEAAGGKCRAQRAGEMMPPLGPVEASLGKWSAAPGELANVDS